MNKLGIKMLALALACAVAIAALAACAQEQDRSSAGDTFANEPTEVESEATSLDTEPFYVLVVGNDTRLGTSEIDNPIYADGNARADTSMLVRVDPTNYQLTFVTIPRNTQDWINGDIHNINEVYTGGGMKEFTEHVEALTGVKVKYYLNSTFVQFEDLVNKLGGIHANVPINMSMTDIVSGNHIEYPAGEQDLDGAQALVFARERHKYNKIYGANEEAYRQSDDRYIAELIIQKIISDPATAASLTKELASGLDTDWPLDDLAAYAQDFMEHASEVTYISGTGPYEGGIEETTGLWMTYRDEDLWAQIMAVVDQGGDPNTVLSAPSAL